MRAVRGSPWSGRIERSSLPVDSTASRNVYGRADERRVAGVNRTWGNVRLEDANGNAVLWRPGDFAAAKGGVGVYRGEAMEAHRSDKVRFTRNDPGSGLTESPATGNATVNASRIRVMESTVKPIAGMARASDRARNRPGTWRRTARTQRRTRASWAGFRRAGSRDRPRTGRRRRSRAPEGGQTEAEAARLRPRDVASPPASGRRWAGDGPKSCRKARSARPPFTAESGVGTSAAAVRRRCCAAMPWGHQGALVTPWRRENDALLQGN